MKISLSQTAILALAALLFAAGTPSSAQPVAKRRNIDSSCGSTSPSSSSDREGASAASSSSSASPLSFQPIIARSEKEPWSAVAHPGYASRKQVNLRHNLEKLVGHRVGMDARPGKFGNALGLTTPGLQGDLMLVGTSMYDIDLSPSRQPRELQNYLIAVDLNKLRRGSPTEALLGFLAVDGPVLGVQALEAQGMFLARLEEGIVRVFKVTRGAGQRVEIVALGEPVSCGMDRVHDSATLPGYDGSVAVVGEHPSMKVLATHDGTPVDVGWGWLESGSLGVAEDRNGDPWTYTSVHASPFHHQQPFVTSDSGTLLRHDLRLGKPGTVLGRLDRPLANCRALDSHQLVLGGKWGDLIQVDLRKPGQVLAATKDPYVSKLEHMELSPDGQNMVVSGHLGFSVYRLQEGAWRLWSHEKNEMDGCWTGTGFSAHFTSNSEVVAVDQWGGVGLYSQDLES